MSSSLPTLVFATGNPNKLSEVQLLLDGKYKVLGLKDLQHTADLEEDFETLTENAIQKATFIRNTYNLGCFSEDSGLEIDALQGRPGVHSADYAQDGRSATSNIAKVLQEMEGIENRGAQFRAVIAIASKNGEIHTLEGIVRGHIRSVPCGKDGFGYDPIFQPEGFDRTFAEMTKEEKTSMSHRGQAIAKLVAHLGQP